MRVPDDAGPPRDGCLPGQEVPDASVEVATGICVEQPTDGRGRQRGIAGNAGAGHDSC